MSGALLIFEDRHWRALRPLTDLTPVPALAFGGSDLAGRWRRQLGAPLLAIEARAAVLAAWREAPAPEASARAAAEVLIINSAALPGAWLEEALAHAAPALFMSGGRIAGARLPIKTVSAALGSGAEFEPFLEGLGLPGVPVEAHFLSRPWDFVAGNPGAITADLEGVPGAVRGEVHPLAALMEPGRIVIEAGARIEALAVLDAREGPIRIGPGARVRPHTVVTGPCVVGERTELLGGFISRSTFGPQCRVAGEVEDCVWQGYANKRHHGFVGHSVIGEWANLGALTTTSDLKNNYGTVRVWVDGAEEESGATKVGAFIGAHVKTGIGTLLPTGAALGVGSNLFGAGRYAPRSVPSFAWWDGERMVEHRLDAFLATARVALSRRGRDWLAAEEALLRLTFELTAAERGAAPPPRSSRTPRKR